ncbi:MAG: thiol:disulfide interchange protein DsbA/DsbL [Pseudomonadota bacterium]
MRFFQNLISSVVLLGAMAGVAAAPATPREGADFLGLPQAQNTSSGNKVEVTEFFAYYCPHCHLLEPALAAWVKKQGDNIVFKRVHVPRDANVLPQQRLFFTLESLGLLEKYHASVFEAMHGAERLRLNSDELVFDWAEKAGIERAKFVEAYRSFGIQAKLNRSVALMDGYKIDQWPMLAIDGRFITSPTIAGRAVGVKSEAEMHVAVLRVADFLVAQVQAEKKAAAKGKK